MSQYILRRFLQMIPITFGILTLVFSLIHMIPGDPAVQIAGEGARPEDVARALIALGIDAVTTGMAGRKGLPDEQQLDFARQENRAVYTVDPDFLRIAADFQKRGAFFPGIVYHSQGSRSKRQVIDRPRCGGWCFQSGRHVHLGVISGAQFACLVRRRLPP